MTKSAKRYLPQVIACLLAANGSFISGINIGWSSQIQERLVDNKEYGYEISPEEFGWISSLVALGGAIGGPGCSLLLNKIGRKWSILALFIPYVIGWVLILVGVHIALLYAGRFILGVCSGGFLLIVPIYICEVADKRIRGLLATFQQLFMVLGIEFVYCFCPFMSVRASGILCLVYPVVVAIPFIFMPESPAFLVAKQKLEKAAKAMEFFYGKDHDVEADIERLKVEAEHRKHISCSLILSELRKFEVRYALLVVLGLHVFQQGGGIRGIMFYATHIFREAIQGQQTAIPASASTIILGAIQIASVAIAMFVVDKSGRKILLIISGSAMALVTLFLGCFFHFKCQESGTLPRYVPLILVCLYIVVYSLGFGPVSWILSGELFTPASKEFCVGIAVFINWMLAFVVTVTYQPTIKAFGIGAVFWIYMFTILIGVVFVVLFVFETKGLTLAEIIEKMQNRELLLWSCLRSNDGNET